MAASPPIQHFIARSKAGLAVYPIEMGRLGTPEMITEEPTKQCRFSSNGKRMGYATAKEVIIMEWCEAGGARELCRVPVVSVDFVFSPMGRYLGTFEKPSTFRMSNIHSDL